MADTVRIQLELPPEKVRAIDALIKKTGASTRKDYFNNALAILEWAIQEKEAGKAIASIDEERKEFNVLVMPILSFSAK